MALQSATIDLTYTLQQVQTAGLFRSLCNIKQPPDPSTPTSPLGQIDWTNFTAVPSLQNIPCMAAPLVTGRPATDSTVKLEDLIRLKQVFHVLLNGYFPAILKTWQAVVDGTALEILAVEWDSQHIMTRLAVRAYGV